MRPVRITGVVGTSPVVPLDTYSPTTGTLVTLTGAGTAQYTVDNVFDSSITPTWIAAPAAVDGTIHIPPGTRGVRATGMAAPDILTVSEQALA
jgi:hypothetical protein